MSFKSLTILILSLTLVRSFACCDYDPKTFYEKVLTENVTLVLRCEVLSSTIDEYGRYSSQAIVKEVILGEIKTDSVQINTGSSNSSARGRLLDIGVELVIFDIDNSNYLACCAACDGFTFSVLDNSKNYYLDFLRQISEIQRSKRSTKFKFYDASNQLLVEGKFKRSEMMGEWVFYKPDGAINAEYNYPIAKKKDLSD